MILYVLTPVLSRQVKKRNVRLGVILIAVCCAVDIMSIICMKHLGEPIQSFIRQPFRIWTWVMYYYMGGFLRNYEKIVNRMARGGIFQLVF